MASAGEPLAHGKHIIAATIIRTKLLLLVVALGSETGTGTLALDPVVAGGGHATVLDSPDFLSKVLGELGRVSDDDDTTLERLDGLGKSTKGVTIEVVGGLVEDDQVRTLPRAGGEDDLDTLASGETTHARVRDELSVDTEVGAVLLNLLADKGTELTRGEGLLLIDLGNELLVRLHNLVTGDPCVVGSHHRGPLLVLHADVVTKRERTLVLVRVLELSTAVDADNATHGAFDAVDLVHGLLVLVGDNLVGTIHGLAILASLETPLNVLGRSRVEVVIDMSESVLLDVGDTDVLVLVDVSGGGDKLTSEDVDKGRLAGTVGANDGDTGTERALEGNVLNLGLGGTGVLEGHVVDTDNGLGLGLDTLEETGLRELELDLGGAELVVRLGGWHALDKLGELTTVTLQLEALVVDNVLNNVVQELGVVGDDDGSARGGGEVVLEPCDVLDIHVVGGLVEEEDIGLLENGTGERQLHLPTSGKGTDGALDLLVIKVELDKGVADLLVGLVDADRSKLLLGPLEDSELGVVRVEIVLDVDGLDLGLLGETLDLLVVDGAHEGGLAGTVGSEETVALATLEAEMGLVEQDLGTVGQVECAVAEILTLLLIRLDGVGLGGTWRGALAESLGNVTSLGTGEDADEGDCVGGPRRRVGVLLVDELSTDGTNVLDNGLELVGLVAGNVLEDVGDGADVAVLGDLGCLAVNDASDTGESLDGLLGLATSLGVSKVVLVAVEGGQELGQERGDNLGVLDKLAHVVDDDGSLTLDGGLTLVETTLEQRNHDGEGGLVDVGDEGGGTEQVNGLGHVLGLGDTLDELGNETLDILVDNQATDLLHGAVGLLLDLGLGVPHGLGDNGDQVGDAVCGLSRRLLGEKLDAVKIAHLLGPLLGVPDGLDKVRNQGLDGVGVDGAGDGKSSGVGSVLDRDNLVTDGVQDGGEKSDEVRLDGGVDLAVRGNGLDGIARTLAGDGILLAGELLLQRLDGPERMGSARHILQNLEFLVNLLGGCILLLNVTVDEGGNFLRDTVDLVLLLGNVELGKELVEHLDRLFVLRFRHVVDC